MLAQAEYRGQTPTSVRNLPRQILQEFAYQTDSHGLLSIAKLPGKVTCYKRQVNGDTQPLKVKMTDKASEIMQLQARLRRLEKELAELRQQQPAQANDSYNLIDQGDWLYRELLEAIPDPVVVYDTQGKTVYINQAFVDIYGYSREAVLHRRIDFVPAEEKQPTFNAWQRTLEGEKVFLETKRLTKAGKLLNIQLRTALILDQQGEHRYSIVIHNDVTEAKRSEGEKLKREKLQAAMETAGAVCHEMSQPLQAILTVIELMQAEGPDSQAWPRRLDSLRQQVERLTRTTKQLSELTDFKTKAYINQVRILDLDQASPGISGDQ